MSGPKEGRYIRKKGMTIRKYEIDQIRRLMSIMK
jgi:hypothetical protein